MSETLFQAVRLNATTYPPDECERTELQCVSAELLLIEGQTPDEILSAAADCDALLVVSSHVPGEVIDGLTRCRVISRLGAGTDKIDIAAATRCGIVVANIPDFCLDEVAEQTMTLLLAWGRRLMYMVEQMRLYNWVARRNPAVHRLRGQTLGLIGLGQSAQAVAVRARAFGLHLLAWVRNPPKYQAQAQTLDVELVSWEQLLARSDFVSLHLPLTPETRHILDARSLALMKPNAVLLNTARGALVDEAALVESLRSRRIAGAGLDVFEGIDVFALPGTPAHHPLLELDNVILTPHCAGTSVESHLDAERRGAQHAAVVLAGHWPPHIVNPEVKPRFPLT